MKPSEYTQAALVTANMQMSLSDRLGNWAVGLCGEAGEIAEHAKKAAYHHKELDRGFVALELGDVMWYAALVAHEYRFDFDLLVEGARVLAGSINSQHTLSLERRAVHWSIKIGAAAAVLAEFVEADALWYNLGHADSIKRSLKVLVARVIITGRLFSLTLEEMMQRNIAKLQGRYPSKFAAYKESEAAA